MPFTCSICAEESTRICVRCTKDACDNHLCEKCRKCSDCCECEVALSPHAPESVREAMHAAVMQTEVAADPVAEIPPIPESQAEPVAAVTYAETAVEKPSPSPPPPAEPVAETPPISESKAEPVFLVTHAEIAVEEPSAPVDPVAETPSVPAPPAEPAAKTPREPGPGAGSNMLP